MAVAVVASYVNPNVKGVSRGGERIVAGSDGTGCYTNDPYQTFHTVHRARRMTDPRPLFDVHGSAHLLMLEAEAKAAAEAIWGWHEAGLTVRTVRGRKMRTVGGLFDEMAAALQFPSYFGENWAAFDECLADMDWLPMNVGIVVVVLDPSEVLADAADAELGVLVRTIAHAADAYSAPIESGEWWDRPAVPFHVVLQPLPTDAAAVRAHWLAAGAEISEFVS